MTRLVLLALAPLLIAAPAAARQMAHDQMPGMSRPAPATPPPAASPQSSMPGMSMPGMSMPGMSMPAPGATSAAAKTPGWTGHYAADLSYDPTAMAEARASMRHEMGGMSFSKVWLEILEYQAGSKGGGYRWSGQGWFGGDINRLVVRSEGEGVGDGLETAEAQALYSRAVSRYVDVQAGVRQDFSPRARTYATVGAQALFPFWFETEGALFLSAKGEVLARAEGTYDLRLFQRVVLQPRVELNLAAQDSPATRTGSGLSTAEAGLRLRYEIRREFAPYVGVSWERRFGRTADYWRAAGDGPSSTTVVVGLSTFF